MYVCDAVLYPVTVFFAVVVLRKFRFRQNLRAPQIQAFSDFSHYSQLFYRYVEQQQLLFFRPAPIIHTNTYRPDANVGNLKHMRASVLFCLLLVIVESTIVDATYFTKKRPPPFLNYSFLRMRGGELEAPEKEPETAHEYGLGTTPIPKNINFVFSDVDGTLVHYPDEVQDNEPGNKILYLPASSTGMRGIISSKTLQLCQQLRREHNVKLVLVSGMRTSTLINRLPYLPKADAYASEAGGRIFYTVSSTDTSSRNIIYPEPFDGATSDDLMPFGLKEDESWRTKLSDDDAAGTDGYIGDSMDIFLGKQEEDTPVLPIDERRGILWDFAKELQAKGFVIDFKGYSNCFRVNRKQQNNISNEEFEELKAIDAWSLGLATSVNLGCIDFYPINSGKKNW